MKTQAKLPEVVWFQEGPGVRKYQYRETGIKLLNVANLVNGKVDLSTSNRYISTEEAYGKYKHFLVDDGDLIIASSGIQVSYFDKKMGFANKSHLPLCMNTSTIRFKTKDSSVLDIHYFMYFLKSHSFKGQLAKQITGSAQLNFGPSHLQRMIISFPPVQEQEKIVAELDCLTGIIEKKKQQLKELDNLAQSIFYDMFGDPITNDKGWEMRKVGDCMKVIGGYAFKSSSYSKSGYRLVQIANVWKDELVWDEITYISFDDKQVSSSFILKEGDVLMAMTRPVIKSLSAVKIAIVRKEDTPCILNQRVCKFVSDGRLSIIWFYNFARTEYFKDSIVGFSSKGMQPNVSAREIESIKMYLPPKRLQDLYAQKIEAIEKQKALMRRSIVEIETLFNSRMDYWFN